jgi:hypothetical protein
MQQEFQWFHPRRRTVLKHLQRSRHPLQWLNQRRRLNQKSRLVPRFILNRHTLLQEGHQLQYVCHVKREHPSILFITTPPQSIPLSHHKCYHYYHTFCQLESSIAAAAIQTRSSSPPRLRPKKLSGI